MGLFDDIGDFVSDVADVAVDVVDDVGDAVGAVVQGAEQGQQILHMLASVQAFDIDRLETQLGRTAPEPSSAGPSAP